MLGPIYVNKYEVQKISIPNFEVTRNEILAAIFFYFSLVIN